MDKDSKWKVQKAEDTSIGLVKYTIVNDNRSYGVPLQGTIYLPRGRKIVIGDVLNITVEVVDG